MSQWYLVVLILFCIIAIAFEEIMLQIHNPENIPLSDLNTFYGYDPVTLISKGYQMVDTGLTKGAKLHLIVQSKSIFITVYVSDQKTTSISWSLMYNKGATEEDKKFTASSSQPLSYGESAPKRLFSTNIGQAAPLFDVRNAFECNIVASQMICEVHKELSDFLNSNTFGIKQEGQSKGLKFLLPEEVSKTNPELAEIKGSDFSYHIVYATKENKYSVTPRLSLNEKEIILNLIYTSSEMTEFSELYIIQDNKLREIIETSMARSVYEFFEQ